MGVENNENPVLPAGPDNASATPPGPPERMERSGDSEVDTPESLGSEPRPGSIGRSERDGTPDPMATNDQPLARRSAKPPAVKSIAELIRYAYAQGGNRRLAIPSSSFQELARSLDDDVPHPDPMLALVAELSGQDPLLAVPVRLLIAAEQSSRSHRLTQRLLSYIGVALRLHDACRRSEVRRLLDRESNDLDGALGALRETVRGLPDEVFASGETKGDLRAKLQQNATISVSLWFAMTTRVADGEFLDILNRHVWRPELAESIPKRPRAVLAESRTPEVLGWLARELQRRVDAATSAAEASERVAERARARQEDAEGQLELSRQHADQLLVENARLEAAIATLRDELENQQRQRVVDRTHHADDYKGLRARVLRSLDKQSALLGDALHALRDQRYVVADEFVERSVEAIDRERERLREQGA